MRFARPQHRFGLCGGRRHACFAKPVLTCLGATDRVLTMAVWPSADAYGVDPRIGNEFLGSFKDALDAELCRSALAALPGPVRDGGELDPGNRGKPGGVTFACI